MYVLESSDESPREREKHVRNVVRLSDDSEPAINHDTVAHIGLDDFGVLDSLPWNLREGFSLHKLAMH